jgi:hypothetical protein
VLLALALLISSLSLSGAQTVPPNEMAGRERERFLQSPVERFMRPGAEVAPPVVEKPRPRKRRAKHPPRRKHR